MRIKYPYIIGNDICDGTVHLIEPIGLYSVSGLPLFVFEYYDLKYDVQCIAILLWDGKKFYKTPLLGYLEFFEVFENGGQWLQPIGTGILPYIIESYEPVYDWPGLIALIQVGDMPSGDAPELYAYNSNGVPPNDPPVYMASRNLPPTHNLTSLGLRRNVINLYIDGETVMRKDDSVLRVVSYESLCRLLDKYDVIWRHTDETLASEKEINVALSAVEREMPCRIWEIVNDHINKPLPLYYGRYIHRYRVEKI